jgi:hypothetical protein
MAATYMSAAVMALLDQAQQVIDEHLVRCVLCGTSKPCVEREEAEAVFRRYGMLPRRRPGLTNARRDERGGFGWLEG